jgi:flagellar basal body P-ring formation protein FlgA
MNGARQGEPAIDRPGWRIILVAFATGVALSVTAPVPAIAQVGGELPVAARDLPRGIALAPSDIRYETGREPVPPGTDRIGAGWITRRVISAGEVLREPAVGRPQLVRAGEPVELLWKQGTIELRVRGTAMGAAAEGERVTVRIDTRRRMDGVAVAPGLVHINGGSGER